MALTQERAQQLLGEWFAPWVQDLGLVVEAVTPGHVTVRLPHSDRLTRGFGALSGQAMMAATDTATVLATVSTLDEEVEVTTVSQTINFLRPVVATDVMVEVDVVKSGRTLAFANALVYAAGQRDKPAATASLTYAVLRR